MKKRLILAALSAALVLLLNSCADATVTYGVYYFPSGEMYFEYAVEIDETTINDSTYNGEMIIAIASDIFAAYGYETYVDEERPNIVYAWEYYESRTEYNIKNGITGDELPDEYDENFFKVGGLFYNNYVSRQQTVFKDVDLIVQSVIDNIPAIYQDLGEEFVEKLRNDIMNIRYDTLLYVFKYETGYKSIESDADRKEIDEETGLYAHIYEMQYADIGRTIELKSASPNYTTWAAIAIAAAAVVTAVMFLFGKRTKGAV
ncbi:MAG: hypothetical protein LBQ27_04405 [Clostridiales bacterium]|jgi:hypothetical protein|nr:hypothetical protein [Clostridiales bacterium]